MAALMANQDSFDICLVASDRPAVGLETAAAAGHETVLVDRNMYRSRQEHESELANKLVCQKPDMIVLAGYMSVLSSTFIERFDGHIINIHPPFPFNIHFSKVVLQRRQIILQRGQRLKKFRIVLTLTAERFERVLESPNQHIYICL